MNAGKLQLLTVAAMLLLVSGGIAAHAQNPYASVPAGQGEASNPSHEDYSASSMFTSSGALTTFSTPSTTSSFTTTTTGANHTLCQDADGQGNRNAHE